MRGEASQKFWIKKILEVFPEDATGIHLFSKHVLSGYYGRIGRAAGEGSGTPLQYSCLENPMDGGAWWAAVHGVAKSSALLSNFTFTFHFHAVNTCRGGSVSSFANPSLPSRVRWIFYQPWFPTWCPRKGRSTVRQPLIILCSVFFKISASFSIKGSRGIRKVKILKSNLITSLKSPFFSVRVGLWFGRTF